MRGILILYNFYMLEPWMIKKIKEEEEHKKRQADEGSRLEIQIETPNNQSGEDQRDQYGPKMGVPVKKDSGRGVVEINFAVKPR